MSHQGSSRELRRARSLTEKREGQLESLLNKYFKRYESSTAKLVTHIAQLVEIPKDDEQLVHNFESDLTVIFNDYSEKIRDLCEFLSRYNTEESVSLQGDIDKKDQEIQAKVKLCFEEVKNLLSAKVEGTPDREQSNNETELHASTQPFSGRSHRSTSAGLSLRSIHAQKKAKAETDRSEVEILERRKNFGRNKFYLLNKIRCTVLRHKEQSL
jgi:hypothetical protein